MQYVCNSTRLIKKGQNWKQEDSRINQICDYPIIYQPSDRWPVMSTSYIVTKFKLFGPALTCQDIQVSKEHAPSSSIIYLIKDVLIKTDLSIPNWRVPCNHSRGLKPSLWVTAHKRTAIQSNVSKETYRIQNIKLQCKKFSEDGSHIHPNFTNLLNYLYMFFI